MCPRGDGLGWILREERIWRGTAVFPSWREGLAELGLQPMGSSGDGSKLFQGPTGPPRGSLTGPGPRLSPGHSELSLGWDSSGLGRSLCDSPSLAASLPRGPHSVQEAPNMSITPAPGEAEQSSLDSAVLHVY